MTLPIPYDVGSSGGPGYGTLVYRGDSGGVATKETRAAARRYRLDYNVNIEDAAALISFYHCRYGSAYHFQITDPNDCRAEDETCVDFLMKGGRRVRNVSEITIDPAATVDAVTGEITPPGTYTASFTYEIDVRILSFTVTASDPNSRTISIELEEELWS